MDVTGAGTANGTTVQLCTCNGTNAQKWTASNGELINTWSGKCLDATGISSADGTRLQIWSCGGGVNQLWTLPTGGGNPTPTPTGPGGTAPDLGPNVHLFDPSMSMSLIQSTINSVYSAQQTNQFGTRRDAVLFKPGTYNVDIPEGFNTQVAGLGLSPDSVSITGGGIHVDAAWSGGNATQNFWREAENFSVTPSSGTVEWAVSQADPFRRIDVTWRRRKPAHLLRTPRPPPAAATCGAQSPGEGVSGRPPTRFCSRLTRRPIGSCWYLLSRRCARTIFCCARDPPW